MLKHPMQSLASVVDQIAKKDGEVASVASEQAPEPQAPVAEESAPVEEVKEADEPVQEEVKEGVTATESTTEAEQAPTEEAAA